MKKDLLKLNILSNIVDKRQLMHELIIESIWNWYYV